MTPISHLHAVGPATEPIDLGRAQRAARELLTALGCDLTDESVRETPRRMAEAFAGLLTARPFRATAARSGDGDAESVSAREPPFPSPREIRLLPSHGVAHFGYLPGERIV